MYHLSLIFLILGLSKITKGQTAYEGSFPLNAQLSKFENGLSIELEGSIKNLQKIIDHDLNGANQYNLKSIDGGITKYPLAIFSSISTSQLNYYTRIEQSGRSGGQFIQLYFFVQDINGIYLRSSTHFETIKKAKNYLISLDKKIRLYDTEDNIKETIRSIERMENQLKQLERGLTKSNISQFERKTQKIEVLKIELSKERIQLSELQKELEGLLKSFPHDKK